MMPFSHWLFWLNKWPFSTNSCKGFIVSLIEYNMRNIFPEKLCRKWGRETRITCMENCCYVSAGAPSCYLELLDKVQQGIWRTFGPSLAVSLKPLDHRWNAASLVFSVGITFVIVHLKCFHFLILEGGLLVILIQYMILSPFLDVIRMSVSSLFSRTSSLWNSLPIECFALIYNLNGFKSRINRHLLTTGSF